MESFNKLSIALVLAFVTMVACDGSILKEVCVKEYMEGSKHAEIEQAFAVYNLVLEEIKSSSLDFEDLEKEVDKAIGSFTNDMMHAQSVAEQQSVIDRNLVRACNMETRVHDFVNPSGKFYWTRS